MSLFSHITAALIENFSTLQFILTRLLPEKCFSLKLRFTDDCAPLTLDTFDIDSIIYLMKKTYLSTFLSKHPFSLDVPII